MLLSSLTVAKADFEAGYEVESFDEDFPRIECAVEVGVFQNHNAVFAFAVFRPNGICVGFRQPHAPAFVVRPQVFA